MLRESNSTAEIGTVVTAYLKTSFLLDVQALNFVVCKLISPHNFVEHVKHS